MFWVEPFKRGWQNTALWQISGVSLERNGSESLKLWSGSLCFQHGRDLLSAETIGWLYSLLSQGADQSWNKVWQANRRGGSVSFWCSGLETTVFHVCGLLVGDISFVTICTFWKLTLITLNSLWNNFGHVLMIEICSVLSGSGCWRMCYTIYENRPHLRHFTVHCLQWSITFLTEYSMDTV